MARLSPETKQRARALRGQPTEAEKRLWNCLRQKGLAGWRFRRQHPIPPYVADFACIEARLVIEADGGQHAGSEHDERRTRHLEGLGWRVLRFWNADILCNIEGVAEVILATLGPHPGPPPPRRGRE